MYTLWKFITFILINKKIFALHLKLADRELNVVHKAMSTMYELYNAIIDQLNVELFFHIIYA